MAADKSKEESKSKPRADKSPGVSKQRTKVVTPTQRQPMEPIELNEQHSLSKAIGPKHEKSVKEAKFYSDSDNQWLKQDSLTAHHKRLSTVDEVSQDDHSKVEKSTMTDLSSAELDLIMTNFASFKKLYQVREL